jgi:hypothetical protein
MTRDCFEMRVRRGHPHGRDDELISEQVDDWSAGMFMVVGIETYRLKILMTDDWVCTVSGYMVSVQDLIAIKNHDVHTI